METMHETVSCFIRMKRSGITIERVLDIGAYRGEFTNVIKSVWQDTKVYQFEADERQREYLQEDAQIVALSNEEKETDLYTIEDTGWGSTTGTSLFLEMTDHYKNPIVKRVTTKTLDSLVDYNDDWSKSLIKIDTQGSEIDILEGAKKLLSQKPRFILLEASIRKYNRGAPTIDEVIEYMKTKGYLISDILDRSYINDLLYQTNLLFECS